MSVLADRASGAGVLDRLQVLRSAPTPLRGAPAAIWPPSPRTGVRQLRVAGHDYDENRPSRLHLSNARSWSEEWGPPPMTPPDSYSTMVISFRFESCAFSVTPLPHSTFPFILIPLVHYSPILACPRVPDTSAPSNPARKQAIGVPGVLQDSSLGDLCRDNRNRAEDRTLQQDLY